MRVGIDCFETRTSPKTQTTIVSEQTSRERGLATREGEWTYGGVHDASAVGTDRVGNVPDVDGVQVLVAGRPLHKDLKGRGGRKSSCSFILSSFRQFTNS